MEEKNKAYATFEERDRIASLGGGTAKIEKQRTYRDAVGQRYICGTGQTNGSPLH